MSILCFKILKFLNLKLSSFFCFRKCLHWIIKYGVNARLDIRIKTQTHGAARARRHIVTNADILIYQAILYTNSILFRNTINLRLLSIISVKKNTKANFMSFANFTTMSSAHSVNQNHILNVVAYSQSVKHRKMLSHRFSRLI